ncbi:MAG: response regulator [Proteobacteria bacterium]|nr:response regulator [Pseudomonadota bacterium]
MKLRIRYIFIVILFIIYIPIIISFYISYRNSLSEIKKEFETSHYHILTGIESKINSEIEKINLLLASISYHPEVRRKNTLFCDGFFAELKKDCSYCLNILLADINGNNIGSAVNPAEAHKLNYMDKEWFINGLNGKPNINPPHVSKLFKEKTFMITYPVFNGGKQVAVLGIPINLSRISEEISKNFSVSPKTNIAIVNDKGIVMYNLLFPDLVGGPVKTKAVNDLIFSGIKGGKEIVGYDGLKRYYIFDTIEKINWKVFVSIPPSELYSEGFERIKKQLYISFIVFSFSFFVAIMVSRRFSRNTELLLYAFNDLKSGRREPKSFPTRCCYEFTEIFKVFNETTDSISSYEKEIERLNRFYHLLSEVNQKIVRYDDINTLVGDICKDIINIGRFDLALIAKFCVSDSEFFFSPISFNYSEIIKDEISPKVFAEKKLSSKVFLNIVRKKEPTIIDKCFLNGDEDSIDLTTAYIPIFKGKDLFGILIVGTKERVSFTDKEAALFKEMSDDLGFAINANFVKKEKEEGEILLKNLFANMGEGLVIIDKNKTVVFTNKKYTEMLGKKENEVIGRYCYEILYNFDESCDNLNRDCPAELVFKDGKERSTVFDMIDREGNKKTYSVRFNPIFEGNEIRYVIVIFNDLTDYKKLEQQYLHSQKLESLGRLSAGIAHDFNNILTGIIGSASLAKISTEDEKIHSYLDTIITLSDRAGNLTKSLLTFSRKQTSNPEIINVNEILLNIEKILKRVIGENISVKLQLSPVPLNIFIDPLQFEQIVMNLAVNARDAITNSNGLFKINTELIEITEDFIKAHGYGKRGSYALISFTDNGAGIPQDIIDKVFEPFFTTKEVGKGTGLGLSVVYGIVKSFDGFINVYSEVGKGTTFKVYFPIYPVKAENIRKESNITEKGSLNISVLLVEDEKQVSEVLKSILENFGLSVEVTDNGLSALKILENKSFDLIITDIIMPKMSGVELYNNVKKTHSESKFIFISGYPYDFIKENLMIDVKDLIVKPVTPEKLYNKIVEIFKDRIKT